MHIRDHDPEVKRKIACVTLQYASLRRCHRDILDNPGGIRCYCGK